MTQENATEAAPALALGVWQVERARSEVGFKVRTFWGMLPVKGVFERFDGTLDVRDDGVDGELRIEAASLNTRNKVRDKHLRSADFFDVERYTDIAFNVTSLAENAGELAVTGNLTIGAKSIPLELAVVLDGSDSAHAKLSADTRIPRALAGMTWNRAGMIASEADLHVELELARRR